MKTSEDTGFSDYGAGFGSVFGSLIVRYARNPSLKAEELMSGNLQYTVTYFCILTFSTTPYKNDRLRQLSEMGKPNSGGGSGGGKKGKTKNKSGANVCQ